ncbi:MAG: PIN domain-containing protein [Acidobacteria bacterium]|nr:PIN domain-containing protein [Acidobacteriota bacterium]
MPVLVDTSVWSLLFRRDQDKLDSQQRSAVETLRRLITEKRIRVIGPIRQELLSGIRNADQFERLRHRFRAFEDEELTTADYELAAQINCKCRTLGISTSAIDSIICSIASSRDWEIFTFDEDFRHYSKAVPLRLFQAS